MRPLEPVEHLDAARTRREVGLEVNLAAGVVRQVGGDLLEELRLRVVFARAGVPRILSSAVEALSNLWVAVHKDEPYVHGYFFGGIIVVRASVAPRRDGC